MARMIDPSELEGDDLINWYARSPAEVEAEREAARQDRYDAFINRIGGGVDPKVGAATDASRSADDDELDPTCAPYGGWERDPNFKSYSDRTRRYETQVTHAPGLDYVVRNPGQRPVKFDGCAVWDPRHPLLEAKGPGYASLIPKAIEWGFSGSMAKGAVDQVDRQTEVAPNQRIEWHVAEPGAYEFFDDMTSPKRPPIVLRQTPAR